MREIEAINLGGGAFSSEYQYWPLLGLVAILVVCHMLPSKIILKTKKKTLEFLQLNSPSPLIKMDLKFLLQASDQNVYFCSFWMWAFEEALNTI